MNGISDTGLDHRSLERYGSICAVVVLHALGAYLLIAALARHMTDVARPPLLLKAVKDLQPPPVPEQRPSPSIRRLAPSPPFFPPPEVPVTQTADIRTPITADSSQGIGAGTGIGKAQQDGAGASAEPSSPPAPPAPQKGRAKADWDSCRPRYPSLSLYYEEEGTTRIHFEVDGNSRLIDAVLVKSSGFPRLDDATLKALRDCTFHAEVKDGKAVPSSLTVDLVWSMRSGGWH